MHVLSQEAWVWHPQGRRRGQGRKWLRGAVGKGAVVWGVVGEWREEGARTRWEGDKEAAGPYARHTPLTYKMLKADRNLLGDRSEADGDGSPGPGPLCNTTHHHFGLECRLHPGLWQWSNQMCRCPRKQLDTRWQSERQKFYQQEWGNQMGGSDTGICDCFPLLTAWPLLGPTSSPRWCLNNVLSLTVTVRIEQLAVAFQSHRMLDVEVKLKFSYTFTHRNTLLAQTHPKS